jgi:hypothetical protein
MVAGFIDDAVHDLLQIDGRNEFVALKEIRIHEAAKA